MLLLAERADLVVVDRGYLRIQQQWRHYAAEHLDCPLIQVESEVVIPVTLVSPKEEYSARTIRGKIYSYRDRFLTMVPQQEADLSSLDFDLESMDISTLDGILSHLNIDSSVKPVSHFSGGSRTAQKFLQEFVEHKLDRYPELRNHPELDWISHLSPYLHFGQISPLTIVFRVLERKSPGEEAFLEELIIRRELSMNFVYYNPLYDSYQGIPQWARNTLHDHRDDTREYLYSQEELEKAETHDVYWNAAQREMVFRGKMHGYMRMYWGKKILEWSSSPEQAFRLALYLNNKYELDGRDPNGFTGVAWCFGLHDRAWKERPVFGKIRYMNAKGLKRKFDIDQYVQR
ncbi:MAG: deoxyribodipyrimidine photolyase, partial [bacterium]